MKRRKFVQLLGLTGAPVLLNGFEINALRASVGDAIVDRSEGRVLVIIQLDGGNDGLNTILSLDHYHNLSKARPNLLLPEKNLLGIEDNLALHPSLHGLQEAYLDGQLGIVQSVGYPNQDRSHFRSIDIWNSASPAGEVWTSGWMGRYFEYLQSGASADLASEYPFAVSMNNAVSQTCQGVFQNYSMALHDPFSLAPIPVVSQGLVPEGPAGRELQQLRQLLSETNRYSEKLLEAADLGNNRAEYPEHNSLGQQLKNVALLISGGLQTSVYHCSLQGFDTHADQVLPGNPAQGKHAQLLKELSEAVAAFQQDLQLLGIEERVVGLTFSEFGRRIRSNASFGTDHGSAAPMFLFGSCVASGVLGKSPEIGEDVDIMEGVPMQYDFRDVYGTILEDWFKVEPGAIRDLIHEDYQHLPILNPCGELSTSTGFELADIPLDLEVYPNPFRGHTAVSFAAEGGEGRLSVFDSIGSEIQVLAEGKFRQGDHEVQWNASGYPPGHYFFRIQIDGRQQTVRAVKIGG